jgi:general stress protein YciG
LELSSAGGNKVIFMVGRNGVNKMAGTKAGGQKAAATNRNKYGKDFYAEIGRKGGRNGHTGGFAANPELAKIAGAKGGRISKRGKAKKNA